MENACISIDKLDKIGIDGLRDELEEKNINREAIDRISNFIGNKVDLDEVENISGEKEIVEGLKKIINSINELSKGNYNIQFDLSLVRGQGYYTGTIFEIKSNKFQSSIGGGGRYDNLIGKFTGEKMPAVGFSIGFERIYTLLIEDGFKIPDMKNKVAIIYKSEDFLKAYNEAEDLRNKFDVVLYEMPKKLGKFIDKLTLNGFYGFYIFGEGNEIKQLI
jgi:histidyl-tRNA synthetase